MLSRKYCRKKCMWYYSKVEFIYLSSSVRVGSKGKGKLSFYIKIIYKHIKTTLPNIRQLIYYEITFFFVCVSKDYIKFTNHNYKCIRIIKEVLFQPTDSLLIKSATTIKSGRNSFLSWYTVS